MNRHSALILILLVAVHCNVHVHLWQAKQRAEEYQDTEIRLQHEADHREKVQREQLMGVPESQQSQYKIFPEHYIHQRLDHFDHKFTGSYRQRYWINPDYCTDRKNCPIFLYIGGEGACSPWRVVGGHHVEMAKKHGALLFAVEHRFYGKSINHNGLKLKQLRHLNSQQALADLAHFHDRMTTRFNLTENNKWISFGGSYPGMMSAWFKIKYPHLVYAAVASSPPVHSVVDFHGYHNTISNDLGKPIVGGSRLCKNAVKTAFETIDDMFRSRQHVKLGEMFKSCKPILNTPLDIDNFASSLAGIFDGIIQYNNEMGPRAWNVKKICKKMLSSSDPLQNFADINADIMRKNRYSCQPYDYQGLVDWIKIEKINPKQHFGLRQWIYQTCSQFGYFQGCSRYSDCIFSKFNTIEPSFDLCKKVYNIPKREVYAAVRFSNKYYGDDKPKGNRIVYINGSIDPWHSISVLKDLDETQKAIYIKGTSHCHNMVRTLPTDPSFLTEARKEIEEIVDSWLEDDERI